MDTEQRDISGINNIKGTVAYFSVIVQVRLLRFREGQGLFLFHRSSGIEDLWKKTEHCRSVFLLWISRHIIVVGNSHQYPSVVNVEHDKGE